jgi:hypothetical protein
MTTKPHNGHRSWNAWNVSLWLNNDEGLYRMARSFARQYGIGVGATKLAIALHGESTPDGARYTSTSIREAMRGMLD